MPPNDPPAEFDDNQGQVIESANPPPPSGGSEPEQAAPVTDVADFDSSDDFDYAVLEASIPAQDVKAPEPPAPKSPETQEKTPPTVPEVQPAASPPEPATAQAAPSEVPKTEVTPATPATTPAEPPTQAVASAPDGFDALDRAIQASRDKVIQTVAEQTYALSPQELEAIQVEPEKVIPQLLARVHVNAVQGVLRHVAQQMPAVIGAHMQAREHTSKLEGDFFKAWPQLDKTKHGADIMKVGQVFRQLNPNASFEEFVRHVGAQVVIANGLHVQAAAQPQRAIPAPTAPTPAFQPAGIGRTSAPAQPSQPKNVWEEMIEIMNE